jgi:hypothetical protein
MAIRQESQESFTQIRNVVNTQIANVSSMQEQTEMLRIHIDQQMVIVSEEVLQSCALSDNGEKTAKGVSERNRKEVQRAISAQSTLRTTA